ncbi:hypothetical protein CAPTEDRAFT_132069 [Capitella teleta]|uniref:Fucosyltransferase n=1 Tax=Capitella teleta TaxID=283909 RepID=R7T9A7_CAPTE|nr:hypothetical protein CAPTEDRAFT_132069 [Capitella teleta]|eukprot:ELT87579.1 hypothetical protein CAPTEDRAFT_132069 [Capitella teleta]
MPVCVFTSDKAQIKEAHAVLFRGRRLQNETILPKHRSQTQKWIFFEYEPPNKFWDINSLVPYRHSFNITSTYSFDSDIPLSLPKRTYIAPNKLYSLKRLNVSYARGKTPGRVAWFVSNCHTQSQREKYVKELKKYIRVDVYGECGPLSCGDRVQANRSACDETLLSAPGSYKFYLSFENSFCDDYVTEKLWRLLKEDVLQIVLGAVNYSVILPEETFLNVKDFSSPKSLADFLIHLDKHDDLYDVMMRRKKAIRVELEGLDEPYHCRVCRYLHDHKSQKQLPRDLVAFWGPGRCQHPAVFLDGSAHGVKFRI